MAGTSVRFPGYPAWRSDQLNVLRQGKYHRITTVGRD
jgi:hypothetical protein